MAKLQLFSQCLVANTVYILLFLFFTCDASVAPVIAKYFGTKSRYGEINPYLIEDAAAVNESLARPPSPQCRAIHLSAVIRHGTRYPSTSSIKEIRNLYNFVIANASGNATWLSEIRSQWKMWYEDSMDGRLVENGREDHRNLAQRLVKYFPLLFTVENLRAGRVKFITSSKHRCVNSTIAFKEGLMRKLNLQGEGFEHTVNDALMRFFDRCARLLEDEKKRALVECDRFDSGAEMRRVAEKVADRLQVPYSSLTPDLLKSAFYLCSYEFTILGVVSPWCELFDEMDAEVIEYAGDLKQYWKRGYGYDINSQASCVLFHDLFRRLEQAATESRSGEKVLEAVTVQIGHAETLLPLLTLLGLFKDDQRLTAASFAAQGNRAFRTGRIIPYAANLLMVLYECPDGLRLQARLNERPLPLPGFSNSAPPYLSVRQYYATLLQGCDQEAVCRVNAG